MMKQIVLNYIKKYHMLSPGEICLVGLSGGPDSVCMLHVLRDLQSQIGFSLQAVHVNHKIRGEEALRDADFCRKLCENLGISYFEYVYDVPMLARKHHIGTEEMGRQVRQQAFADCMKKHGAEKLALAHHQNDLAETFLFHLARGTSVGGLAAVRPVRDHIIRPLLCMNREKIEQYVKERGIICCEDSTNAEDNYTRNQIRHHMLSDLTERVNPKAVEHIAAVSGDLMEIQEYLEIQAKKAEAQNTVWDGTVFKMNQSCLEQPALMQRMILMSGIERLCGKRKDITREHLESVLRLFDMSTGRKISLPYGMQAEKTYQGIAVVKRQPPDDWNWDKKVQEEIFSLRTFGGEGQKWRDYQIKTLVRPYKGERIVEKTYTKWFDYDKIDQNAVFRTRKSGDYLVVNASGGRKKLKDYLIDSKVPQKERDNLLLLACGSEVLWVVGYRIGESAKISENTKQMIEIQITGGNTNE